jgi:hypothetical protein
LELYEEYLGKNSTLQERRNFQAYWLQLETEWLRSNRNIAGVLAFCYLTNNYGYTGDWFIDNVKDLKPGPCCIGSENVLHLQMCSLILLMSVM